MIKITYVLDGHNGLNVSHIKVSKTVDDDEQVATLFLVGGTRLEEIHSTLPANTPNSANTEYKKAMHRLTTYFNPKRNTTIEIFKFCQAKQTNDETVEQFITRLRLLATYCYFADVDKELVRQVIQTSTSKKLRRDLL